MRILTNVSKAELDHLVNQPTAKAMIDNFARNNPNNYFSSVSNCLSVLSRYTNRTDGGNAASVCKDSADSIARGAQQNNSSGSNNFVSGASNLVSQGVQKLSNIGNAISDFSHKVVSGASNLVGGFFNWAGSVFGG